MSATLPRNRPGWRKAGLTAVLAATALAGLPGLTGRAEAGVIDAQCAGTFTRTFTPPVTSPPQLVTATSTDSYSTCLAAQPIPAPPPQP